jgi:PAS domain-containing protein
MLYHEEDGVLPEDLFKGNEKRAFGDPIKVFLIVPIRTYDDTVVSYLCVGLNTRRPYDDEYKDWIKVYSNLLGASAASVALYEEEVRNRQIQEEEAAKDRAALNNQVATLTQEASDVTEKLQNFHDIASEVGLGYFETGINGMLVHANVSILGCKMLEVSLTSCQETYFEQTGHQRDFASAPPYAYKDCVYEGDIAMVDEQWRILMSGKPATFDLRWKRPSNQQHASEYLWTLSAWVPIKSEDGTVTGVFGCNTNITAQKEATNAALMRADAERRLASFTELAPVGLYHLNPDLSMKYCNDQWFRISGHPKVPHDQVNWREIVHPDEIENVCREVEITNRKNGPHTFSLRLLKPWKGPDGVSTLTWILATATACHDENGEMSSIMGTMADISQLVRDPQQTAREIYADFTTLEMGRSDPEE